MNQAKMKLSGRMALGMGIGALLMYALDPQQGPRRRQMLRGQVVQLGRSGGALLDTGAERRASVPDRRSHADDALTGKARAGRPSLLAWAAVLGLGALAMSDKSLRRSAADMVRGRSIEVEKSIQIDTTPEQLYDLWSNYDNFPRFMSRVEAVRSLGGDRSHWVVKGPAGTRLEWDSVLTERERGKVLAWRSQPGSTVEHAGQVRFEPAPRGTLATVRLSYRPPGGTLGHAAASLFGLNPRQDLDADLARMKSFVESGQRSAEVGQHSPQASVRSEVGTVS